MESVCNKNGISKEDVIAKLKDDGDFDKLRLKIVRKLKDNEELRNNIISIVKQSAVLNREGAENMRPRQLSDAIYEDVGNKVTSQISDGLWEIIRSGDGMKNEIAETVQTIYNKLLHPEVKEEGGSSTHELIQKEADSNCSLAASATEIDDTFYDSGPKEPPGFRRSDSNHNNNQEEQNKKEQHISMTDQNGPTKEQMEDSQHLDVLKADDAGIDLPPGFSAVMEQKQPSDDSDEDPELPPGFA